MSVRWVNLVLLPLGLFNIKILKRDSFLRCRLLQIMECKKESKISTLVFLRSDFDRAIERLDDLLWNHEAKSYTLSIHLHRWLQAAKQLEKFLFIICIDSYAGIYNRGYKHFVIGVFIKEIRNIFYRVLKI